MYNDELPYLFSSVSTCNIGNSLCISYFCWLPIKEHRFVHSARVILSKTVNCEKHTSTHLLSKYSLFLSGLILFVKCKNFAISKALLSIMPLLNKYSSPYKIYQYIMIIPYKIYHMIIRIKDTSNNYRMQEKEHYCITLSWHFLSRIKYKIWSTTMQKIKIKALQIYYIENTFMNHWSLVSHKHIL